MNAHRVQPPLLPFAWTFGLFLTFLVCLALATGYYVGRTSEVVCFDELEGFHPLSERYPNEDHVYGIYAICGSTPVVILD